MHLSNINPLPSIDQDPTLDQESPGSIPGGATKQENDLRPAELFSAGRFASADRSGTIHNTTHWAPIADVVDDSVAPAGVGHRDANERGSTKQMLVAAPATERGSGVASRLNGRRGPTAGHGV